MGNARSFGEASTTIRGNDSMRTSLILGFTIAVFVGCNNRADVQCETTSDCNLSGGGMCVPASTGNMWCAYPDPECPGGYRWSTQNVGDGFSGECVPDGSVHDAGIDTHEPDANLPVADWATRFGGPSDDTGVSIASASNGDIVAVGSFTGTMNVGGPALSSAGQTDVWVGRYHADGSYVWSVKLGGIGADSALGTTIDAAGDVYVVGHFVGPVDFGGGSRTNANGGFLVKLNGTSGAWVWDSVFGASVADLTGGVAVVDGTTVAIGGRFTGTVDFGGGNVTATPSAGFDSFVAAYATSSGAHVWSKALVTTGNDGDFGGVTATGGDVIVTAGFFGTATIGGSPLVSASNSEDVLLARYHGADGSYVWSVREGGAMNEYPKAIATDGTHVYVGGQFLGTTNLGGADIPTNGSYDGFVASYNVSNASLAWAQKFGGANNDAVTSLAVLGTKLIAVISFSSPTITIGTQMLTSAGGIDIGISRLNAATGDASLTAPFGSTGDDTMAVSFAGSKLAGVGTFSANTNLFSTALTSEGGKDIAAFRVDF